MTFEADNNLKVLEEASEGVYKALFMELLLWDALDINSTAS